MIPSKRIAAEEAERYDPITIDSVANKLSEWSLKLNSLRTNTTTTSTLGTGQRVEGTSGDDTTMEEGEGKVTLNRTEVDDLQQTIDSAVNAFLSPLSRADLFSLLHQQFIQSQSIATTATSGRLNSFPLRLGNGSSSVNHQLPPRHLPSDIISLIIFQWRALFVTDERNSRRSPQHQSWIELGKLAKVDKSWEGVAGVMRRKELHITRGASIPPIHDYLANNPKVAQGILRLYFKLSELDFLGRNTDAGFYLPELLRLTSNIRTLSILVESTGRLRRFDFDKVTGGFHLPSLIAESTSITNLVYSPPCHIDDVVSFLTKMSLTSLEVLGSVTSASSNQAAQINAIFGAIAGGGVGNFNLPNPAPNVVAPLVSLSTIHHRLTRVWTPTTAYTPQQLTTLFTASSIKHLALVLDIEAVDNPVVPTEEEMMATLAEFKKAFGTFGSKLKSLTISSPHIGLGSSLGGIGIGMGMGNIQMTFGVGALPGAVGAVGAGGAGGAVNPAPPAPAPVVAGAAGAAPALVAPAAGGGVNAGANNNLNQLFMGGGGLNGLLGGLFGQMAGNNAAGAAGGGGGGGGAAGNAGGQDPPPILFYDDIVVLCPHLEALELYGRNYTHALVSILAGMELTMLSLMRSSGEEGALLFRALVELLQPLNPSSSDGKMRATLKELNLCSRGEGGRSDWKASERKEIQALCNSTGVKYRSTNVNSPF